MLSVLAGRDYMQKKKDYDKQLEGYKKLNRYNNPREGYTARKWDDEEMDENEAILGTSLAIFIVILILELIIFCATVYMLWTRYNNRIMLALVILLMLLVPGLTLIIFIVLLLTGKPSSVGSSPLQSSPSRSSPPPSMSSSSRQLKQAI